MSFRRRDVLKAAGSVGAVGAVGAAAVASGQGESEEGYPAHQPRRDPPPAYEDFTTHRVPEQYDTIQRAVEVAEPEDLILVGPGVYNEHVEVKDTPRLTIRGTDRNEVILDGEFTRPNGFEIVADDVVVENMTARHYQNNGFFWSSVSGWRGEYLTAYNNKVYGIYSIDSEHGRFADCYASGHDDSGFYVGQCEPCRARVENVVSEHNAIGYSGTNANGHITVTDSEFRYNMGGIVPNSLDSEANPPQDATRVQNNLVEHNNNAKSPDGGFGYAAFGTGINVAGGINDEVFDNTVRGHVNFGIVAVPMIDENVYPPRDNLFRGNTVTDSGRADLAVGAPQGGGNRFVDNEASSSRPAGLNSGTRLVGGDPWVTTVLFEQFTQLDSGESPSGNWKTGPEPPFDELESMPDPENAPPRPAVRRES